MDAARRIFLDFSSSPTAYPSTKAYDAAAKNYAASITKLSSDIQAVIRHNPIEALQLVDPSVNSIGFLSIIDTLLRGSVPEPTSRSLILDEAVRFLLNFDPIQIRYVGTLFRSLLEDLGSFFSPLVAVDLLANTILRIDPSGSVFTSTHLVMVKLAYDTNCIEPALKVLDADILFYPRNVHPSRPENAKHLYDTEADPHVYIASASLTDTIQSTSILEYHLLQAMVYISRKDWLKAQVALERVVGHPTKDKGVSKIMLDSYKKWLLVGVLREGRPPSLPSYITVTTKSVYNGLSEPYNLIVSLFATDDAPALKEEFERGRSIWEEDLNLTLLEEAIVSYQKWQIINLRRIYQQVSISQIRQTTLSAQTAETLKDDDEVLLLVSDMIETGMLKGQLEMGPTAGESYVTFQEDHGLMTEAEFASAVAHCHDSIKALTKQYRVTSERLGSTKEFARHLVREQKRMDKDIGDAGVGFDTHIEDEDLMTGVLGSG